PLRRRHPADREAPRRHDGSERRRQRGADDCRCENPMPERRRSPPEQGGGRERDDDDDRRLERTFEQQAHRAHREPSFRALATRSATRFSSSSVSRVPSPPRSAATTLAVDPSKNVLTRWRRADFRAAWRATAGIYTYRGPSSSWRTWPLSSSTRSCVRT